MSKNDKPVRRPYIEHSKGLKLPESIEERRAKLRGRRESRSIEHNAHINEAMHQLLSKFSTPYIDQTEQTIADFFKQCQESGADSEQLKSSAESLADILLNHSNSVMHEESAVPAQAQRKTLILGQILFKYAKPLAQSATPGEAKNRLGLFNEKINKFHIALQGRVRD
ncbi:MAG: hypothetical protein ACOYNL_03680 [Rickettsiales bacterium]